MPGLHPVHRYWQERLHRAEGMRHEEGALPACCRPSVFSPPHGRSCACESLYKPLTRASTLLRVQVCQTLVSTGTKAVFLNPTDALHGDIGIVGRDDLVVMFSKSGATEELLRLVPYAKVRQHSMHCLFPYTEKRYVKPIWSVSPHHLGHLHCM